MTFFLAGEEFTALDGGLHFGFNEAVSFVVRRETQSGIDHFWTKPGEGGDPKRIRRRLESFRLELNHTRR